MIKLYSALAVPLLSAVGITLAHAQLRVDFNSTNQDGGPHHLAGFEDYQAGHEVAGDFTAARAHAALEPN